MFTLTKNRARSLTLLLALAMLIPATSFANNKKVVDVVISNLPETANDVGGGMWMPANQKPKDSKVKKKKKTTRAKKAKTPKKGPKKMRLPAKTTGPMKVLENRRARRTTNSKMRAVRILGPAATLATVVGILTLMDSGNAHAANLENYTVVNTDVKDVENKSKKEELSSKEYEALINGVK